METILKKISAIAAVNNEIIKRITSKESIIVSYKYIVSRRGNPTTSSFSLQSTGFGYMNTPASTGFSLANGFGDVNTPASFFTIQEQPECKSERPFLHTT